MVINHWKCSVWTYLEAIALKYFITWCGLKFQTRNRSRNGKEKPEAALGVRLAPGQLHHQGQGLVGLPGQGRDPLPLHDPGLIQGECKKNCS